MQVTSPLRVIYQHYILGYEFTLHGGSYDYLLSGETASHRDTHSKSSWKKFGTFTD